MNINNQDKKQNSLQELNSAVNDYLKINKEVSEKDNQELSKSAESRIINALKKHLYNNLLDNTTPSLDLLNIGLKVQQQLPQEEKFNKLKEKISDICQNTFGRTSSKQDSDAIDINFSKSIPIKKENKTGTKPESPIQSKIRLLAKLYKTNKDKAFNFSTALFSFNDKTNQKTLEKSLIFFLKKDPPLALKFAQHSADKTTDLGGRLAKKAYERFLKDEPQLAESLLMYCQTKANDEKNPFYENLINNFLKLKNPK